MTTLATSERGYSLPEILDRPALAELAGVGKDYVAKIAPDPDGIVEGKPFWFWPTVEPWLEQRRYTSPRRRAELCAKGHAGPWYYRPSAGGKIRECLICKRNRGKIEAENSGTSWSELAPENHRAFTMNEILRARGYDV